MSYSRVTPNPVTRLRQLTTLAALAHMKQLDESECSMDLDPDKRDRVCFEKPTLSPAMKRMLCEAVEHMMTSYPHQKPIVRGQVNG